MLSDAKLIDAIVSIVILIVVILSEGMLMDIRLASKL